MVHQLAAMVPAGQCPQTSSNRGGRFHTAFQYLIPIIIIMIIIIIIFVYKYWAIREINFVHCYEDKKEKTRFLRVLSELYLAETSSHVLSDNKIN